MSNDAVSGSTGTRAVALRNPRLDEILATARTINARPGRGQDDVYFVHQCLGATRDVAVKERNRLQKLLHPDSLSGLHASDAEVAECYDASQRVNICWTASKLGNDIKSPGALDYAMQHTGVASVIIVAAKYADSGLRNVREAWQRRVDDGTVERVTNNVAATAGDLYQGVSKLVSAGWQRALARKSAKKD